MPRNALLVLLCVTTIPAALLCLLGSYPIRRYALRRRLLDRPGGHKGHSAPVPLGGGIAIASSVFATILFGYLLFAAEAAGWIPENWFPELIRPHLDGLQQRAGQVGFLLVAGAALVLIGWLDDVRGVDWRVRLAIQFVIASLSVIWQGWQLTLFIAWTPLAVALSILWIVALINAFNMLDNMDGLSAGVAAIASFALAAAVLEPGVAGRPPQLFIGGFLLVLGGSLIGFLWHNRPPARLYMGDAGSYFVGYCLAVATMLGDYASHGGPRPHAVLIPVCVLAVPLYDLVSVLSIRLWEGRSVFHADNRHFSHRLVALGLSRPRAVLTIYIVATVCGAAGLVLPRVDATGAALVGLSVLGFLAFIAYLERRSSRD